MNFEHLIGFSSFAFVASITPGPNNVLLTAVGSNLGIRRGMPTLTGIALGCGAMILILALAVSQAAAIVDQYFWIIQIIGAVFIMWLAFKIATAPTGPHGEATASSAPPTSSGFLRAALFQWINPKAWLVCAAAISANMDPNASLLVQALTFAAIFVATAVVGCLPWLAFGSMLGRFLKTPRTAAMFNWTMALLLLASMLPMTINALIGHF